jgi:hypothetical protein
MLVYLPLTHHNSIIDARIHLHAPRPILASTMFLTSIKTFNAELKASVTHDKGTPPSEFHLRATNYLGPSYVVLDPKYEGTFDLQTKQAITSVKENNAKPIAPDPLGQRRERGYQIDHSSSSRIFGWVGWGSRPGPTTQQIHQGHVEVATSKSAVTLQLDGAGEKINGQS